MKVINLTPHPISIYRLDSDDVLLEIPASGDVARLAENDSAAGSIWGFDLRHVVNWQDGENYTLSVPVVRRDWSKIIGLPDPSEGNVFIVAMPVLSALNGSRNDVCCPDFGRGALRNDEGTIIGTRRLVFGKMPDEDHGLHWKGSTSKWEQANLGWEKGEYGQHD